MKRHKHSLSHYKLATTTMGKLIPVAMMEVLPGDTFRHQTAALIRLSTLLTPVMHPTQVRIHHWFVPSRLLWAGWEDFITAQDETDLLPTVSHTAAAHEGSLPDYFGLPAVDQTVNALPFRAYNMIWNEFYRDQDLDTEAPEDALTVRNIRWGKDYFTSARANPQQDADTFQVGFSAGKVPVWGIGLSNQPTYATTTNRYMPGGINAGSGTFEGGVRIAEDAANPGFPDVHVDLASATGGIDINDLRQAFALQRFSEARNRFGSRYVDLLRYLGIRPSDGRLDRPEYLGGGKQTISFSEVLATTAATGQNIGDFGGHGIAAIRTRPYRRFFEEHGYVLSLLSVRPKSIYQDATPKKFLRSTSRDFWAKEYEAMGDQPVENQELYGPHATPTGTFGYVQRFRDYREEPSAVAGGFRLSAYETWHMARTFGSDPALNSTFVECSPPSRVFADTAGEQLLMMISHQIAARRLVAKRARF